MCVQRYLSPHPSSLHGSFPHPWRHTRNVLLPPLSSSPFASARSTAPSFLHVNSLARIRPYICTYIYVYIVYSSIYSRQEFRNHPDPEIQKLSETFYSSLWKPYVLSSLLFWYEFLRFEIREKVSTKRMAVFVMAVDEWVNGVNEGVIVCGDC